MTKISRRAYLTATGIAAAGTVGLAGCSESAAATGTLATQVTDQPGDIDDFESCVVTIEGIWVRPSDGEPKDGDNETGETDDGATGDNETAGGGAPVNDGATGDVNETGETDDRVTDDVNETAGEDVDDTDEAVEEQDEEDVDMSGEREYYEFDEPQEADLVELQDGNTKLVDERELEAREYAYLQLDVSGVTGVLASGEKTEVDTPGNAPLQFKEPFEIRDGQTTTFVGDFTPVRCGQTGSYLLQPVAKGTQVTYE